MIRARGRLGRLRRPVNRASTGRPNASVLPDPVRARPSTSRPAIASGRTAAWTPVGATMPSTPRIFRIVKILAGRCHNAVDAEDLHDPVVDPERTERGQ